MENENNQTTTDQPAVDEPCAECGHLRSKHAFTAKSPCYFGICRCPAYKPDQLEKTQAALRDRWLRGPVHYDVDQHRVLDANGLCVADVNFARGDEAEVKQIGQQIADALNAFGDKKGDIMEADQDSASTPPQS